MNQPVSLLDHTYETWSAEMDRQRAASRAPITRRFSFPDGKHRPLGDVRLMLYAIASRLGLAGYPCPYCGTIAPTRWPWQDGSRHLATCDGGQPASRSLREEMGRLGSVPRGRGRRRR